MGGEVRQVSGGGTRFRLYPQFDEGFAAEPVEVSSACGSLAPGPADARMYVADAVDKRREYDPPDLAPPYRGATYAAAEAGPDGHFDGIGDDTPQFRAAHLFGSVRLVLDIWERQAGAPVTWYHPDAPARLELVPVVQWQNAHTGPGFLETGIWPAADGAVQNFCLNMDVVAHEVGHAILFGALGVPPPERLTGEFLAFHECFADMNAVLTALHFPGVRRRLLEQTAGDLYAPNLVNRFAETATHQQLRMVSNGVTMDDVAGLRLGPDGAWIDPLGLNRNEHHLSQPISGAVFDLLVEVYQEGLLERGLIRPLMDARGWARGAVAASMAGIHAEHRRAFGQFAAAFDAALLEARDVVAGWLLHLTRSLEADLLSFGRVAARLLEAALLSGRGRQFPALAQVFVRRGIDPWPELAMVRAGAPGSVRRSRRAAALTVRPSASGRAGCRCELRHVALARRMLPHAHRAA
jgi:hypothetical protein